MNTVRMNPDEFWALDRILHFLRAEARMIRTSGRVDKADEIEGYVTTAQGILDKYRADSLRERRPG